MARHFRLLKHISTGSFSDVYMAEQLTDDGFARLIALKSMRRQLRDQQEFIQRSRDEGRLLGLLRHPCIVRVDDLLTIDRRPTLVMEYIDGVDLKYLLAKLGPVPPRPLAEIVSGVADALDAAYNAAPLGSGGGPLRVIHRDLKPSNIMVTWSGEVKVCNFAAARATFSTREAVTEAMAFGTAAYMAPERKLSQEDTPASDVFSLGISAMELLTGERFGNIPLQSNRLSHKTDQRLAALETNLRESQDAEAAELFAKLLRVSLHHDPADRATASQLVEIADELASRLRGPTLRRWCRDLPQSALLRAGNSADSLVGRTVDEDTPGDETAAPAPPKRAVPSGLPPASLAPAFTDSAAPSTLRAVTVTLEIFRAEKGGDPYAFRWDKLEYLRRLPGGALRSAKLVWEGDLQADLVSALGPSPAPEAQARLGYALREFLLAVGFAQDEQRILQALEQSHPVHIIMRFAAAELFALPWELLRVGEEGHTLGFLPQVHATYEWPSTRSRATPKPADPGRILLAWSAAAGGVPAADHIAAVRAACEGGHPDGQDAVDIVDNASLPAIAAALRSARDAGRPYGVLHLLCHGAGEGTGAGGLVLDGPHGPAAHASTELRELLMPFASDLRLVLFFACRSSAGGVGSHLGSLSLEAHRAGLHSVVGCRTPMRTEASSIVTRTLYEGLLTARRPRSLEWAMHEAIDALREHALPTEALSLQRFQREDDGRDTRPFTLRPYRGLLAFTMADRRFFFGRDLEIAEAAGEINQLRRSSRPRFYVVEGASGVGKSSMVMAGLVPTLLAEPHVEWSWTRMVPGAEPSRALSEALLACPEARSESGEPRRWLLLVDQLEEIFTQVPDTVAGRTEAQNFVRRLWELSQGADGVVHVVTTVRADFRAMCGTVQLEDGLPMDQLFRTQHAAHTLFLSNMGRDELRQAVVRPAMAVGLEITPSLAKRMLDDVGAEQGALPLLAFALDRVWHAREGRRLTQEAYEAIGGVSGALSQHADGVIAALDPSDRLAARSILTRLVAAQDEQRLARLRRLESELRTATRDAAESFDRIVQALVDARLLVRESGPAGLTIEVAHEALIRTWPALRQWVHEDREKLNALQQLEGWAANWLDYRDDGALTGKRLEHALGIARRYTDELSGPVREMLHASGVDVERLGQSEISVAPSDSVRSPDSAIPPTRLVATVAVLVLLLIGTTALVLSQ